MHPEEAVEQLEVKGIERVCRSVSLWEPRDVRALASLREPHGRSGSLHEVHHHHEVEERGETPHAVSAASGVHAI